MREQRVTPHRKRFARAKHSCSLSCPQNEHGTAQPQTTKSSGSLRSLKVGSASSSLSNAAGTGYCRYCVERALASAPPPGLPTDRQWTRATCGLANWLLAMMCSSFVRSLAAMAAICATAFPDLGQNADWSAKNERGEGEGTSAEGGRGGGSGASILSSCGGSFGGVIRD